MVGLLWGITKTKLFKKTTLVIKLVIIVDIIFFITIAIMSLITE